MSYQYRGTTKNAPTIVGPDDRTRGRSGRLLSRCGTNGGYLRHVRAGEYACDPCRAAHAETAHPGAVKRRRRGEPIDHGTNRGYNQHWREGTLACDACLQAHAAYQQERA
ncbi:MAG: hypothetical protein ACTII3_11845, partial [Galactobacter sp.]